MSPTRECYELAALLKAYRKRKDLLEGTRLHAYIIKKGLLPKDPYLGSALISMYAKCGAVDKTQQVFSELPVRNLVSWTALLAGYAQNGYGHEALRCFDEMQSEGFCPDDITLLCALKACGCTGSIDKGKQIHEEIMSKGLLAKEIAFGSALVDMYAKCGQLEKAEEVLDQLPAKDAVSWNCLIAGYGQHDQFEEALNCLKRMKSMSISPDAVTFICLLKICARMKSIDNGKRIHDQIVSLGFLQNNILLGNALVDMYAKCGCMFGALVVLDSLSSKSVISWTSLISGYFQQGQGKEAVECYKQMRNDSVLPNTITFICTLKACGHIGDIVKGKQIHTEILSIGLLGKDVVLGNALVDMYVKCGELTKAQQLIDELPVRDIQSWTLLISGYAQHGQEYEALNCFEKMKSEGITPNTVTFISILKACGNIRALEKGKLIHDEILTGRLLINDIALGNALVDMYAKCGEMTKSEQMLEELPISNVVSWTSVISGYGQYGNGEEALRCFERMECKGVCPDSVTYICALKACASAQAIEKGKQIHHEIANKGLLLKDIVIGNAIVDMYAKCGQLDKAQQVLETLPDRDIVSWNAIIAGYIQQDNGEKALKCFYQLKGEGICPDAITLLCILKACGKTRSAQKGKEIHYEIISHRFMVNNVEISTALVDMYAKCGSFAKAEKILNNLSFQDVVTFTALIAGYVEHGQGNEALECFKKMQDKGIPANAVTFICVLKACGIIGALAKGIETHQEIVHKELLDKDIALGNALVDMYVKCQELSKAEKVLGELHVSDAISWTTIIAGYAKQGQFKHAIRCYKQMKGKGLYPDSVTFLCMLKVCGNTGLFDEGEEFHNEIISRGFLNKDDMLGNAVARMYSRCGELEKALMLLDEFPVQDIVSWNALIAGYAQQGKGEEALICFQKMQKEDVPADSTTLLCVLNACSHAGLVDEGEMHFADMKQRYGVEPGIDHYACMVDLFGRAGHFHKAMAMIRNMPTSDHYSVWIALLSACRKWSNVKLGRLAFEQAVQLHIMNPAPYLLMTSIYAAVGMEEDASKIDKMRMTNSIL